MTEFDDEVVHDDALEEEEVVVEDQDSEPDNEPDAEAEQAPERDWDEATEHEARYFGWKPPEEWKGDKPPGYIDNPGRYMDRIAGSKPFAKLQERMEKRLAEKDDEINRVSAAIKAGHKRDIERQKAEYEREMEKIVADQRRAVEEGDTDEFDRIEARRKGMAPPDEKALEPEAKAEEWKDPLAEFKTEHPWIDDGVIRSTGAQIIQAAMVSGKLPPNATARQQVEYAEPHVKKYFPHLFQTQEEPKPKPRAKVDGGGLGAAKKTGFDSLPKSARDAFMADSAFEDTKEDREFYYNAYTEQN